MHAACLEPLTAEGEVVHIHALLIVYVDGQRQTVPADIGIDAVQQRISALHTHDTTGVVHIESPVDATFTLGQLFTEWDVKLTADTIGGLTADSAKTLRWWVNGQPQSGNPADLTFEAHQILVLAYGSPDEDVEVPTTYEWGNL